MDISRITSQHEGALEIVNSLERLVGGTKYLLLHSTPIINIILLKAMLAWERESEKGLELQFTKFAESILYDLYKVTYFKVSLKKDDEESIHWDCISQTFEEFKVSSLNEKRKNKKCDCFGDDPTKPTKCHCLKVEHIDKRSTLSNEAISLLLARHVFNRRVLNLLGLPLPTRQSVYSLSHSLTEHC
ncbi:hypothetical protein ACRN9Z_16735 [Shewanella frigidimarina]|jgi:hypothetical protein|uniref:hypothetical protein n=1 Tax=Shewanella TaxID=22 RepID=UPI000CAE6B05|nr:MULTISPECIES: hypothetical protein [unclassified Shewanella]MBB1388352.1 hypothetical protein [Shewanella sp. SG44-6]PIX72212.1 MAG: hypothetical protein COZ42_06585 [Shewanella sp. CG_4_10_14_3_um_filter_42_91]PIY65024.1 MAG: hypothetical protein COY92_14380 [Shewanella sp. CG_4_10_14_0_8_um_filter_42_13]|tara:strand:- start:7006 stop:7566 length:561 start_codon:yes stop_codon:yes gene_type:complete